MSAVNCDIDSLAEPFKAKAVRLQEIIKREGLPFRLFECRRSFTRSSELFMVGREYQSGVLKQVGKTVTNARAGSSPHNYGVAVDFILIPREHGFWEGEDAATGPWDDGHVGGRLVRPLVKLAWERYGRAVREAGLTLGGDWKWKDMPHAELPMWKTVRPHNWQEIALREVQAGR